MGGKGVSINYFQAGTSSGKRIPKSGKARGKFDDVVLIDVDSDFSDNVIIIDVPESMQQRLRNSSVHREKRKFPDEGIISIDDDESDVVDHTEIGDKDGGELDSDATSSKRFSPASKCMHNSVDLGGDECWVVHEKRSSFKLSKCKQTCLGKAPGRNHYGLYPETESSSESDCSDCELMEGSFEKLREQWENASLKRKHDVGNGQSGLDDQTSVSGSHTATPTNVEVEQHPEVPACSTSIYDNFEKENLSSLRGSWGGFMGGTSFNPGMESPFMKSDQRVDQTFTEDNPASYKWQSYKHVNGAGHGFCDGEQSTQRPSFWYDQELGDKQSKCTSSNQEQGEMHADLDRVVSRNKYDEFAQTPSSCNAFDKTHANHDGVMSNKAGGNEEQVHGVGSGFCNGEQSSQGPSIWSNQEYGGKQSNYRRSNEKEGETHVDFNGGVLRNKDDEFLHAHSSCNNFHATHVYHDRVMSNSRSSSETQVDYGAVCSADKVRAVPDESFFCKTPSEANSEVSNGKACSQEKGKADFEEIYLGGTRCNETHAQDGDVYPSGQTDIINEREKLKETDEYKRATEEEWASRQRQLRIQAEEAQRLRKRRKSERRSLDMQRRQKQRLEEMRETKKKDEENMNLKEQLRVEIREEIIKLETTCIDMASLLRGLGIQVGGGVFPSSHEVRAAYKRALLKFHPDRASKTDTRQQVEAEEKFKLISRMKEKYLLTSCY